MSTSSRRTSVGALLAWILPGCPLVFSADPPTTVAPLHEVTRWWLQIDGVLPEWDDVPVVLEVPGDGGFRTRASVRAALWHGVGLAFAGTVPEVDPVFEATSETLARGDHLVVWVATSPRVPMPAIGWGSHFGEIALEGETSEEAFVEQRTAGDDDSAKHSLRSWISGQTLYRQRVGRLFQRRWKLTPSGVHRRGAVVEDLATPAFAGLDVRASEMFEPLRPRGGPEVAASANWRPGGPAAPGYSFEILVPWTTLPPFASLRLDQVFVRIEVHRPHPETEGADGDPPWPDDSSSGFWTRLQLERPLELTVGDCHAPLEGLDRYGDWRPAFFPAAAASNRVDEVFVLANDARAYQDLPEGFSPILVSTEFFSREVGEGELVCGPALTWSRQGRSLALTDDARRSDEGHGMRVPSSMEARREGDDLLVRIGPVRIATVSEGASPDSDQDLRGRMPVVPRGS